MKITGFQSCPSFAANRPATMLLAISIGTVVFGILAIIGALHPSSALGIPGNPIKVYGAGIILGVGIVGGLGSLVIFCRKRKPAIESSTIASSRNEKKDALQETLNELAAARAENDKARELADEVTKKLDEVSSALEAFKKVDKTLGTLKTGLDDLQTRQET